MEPLEQRTLLSGIANLGTLGDGLAIPAAVDTPPELVGTGMPDVTENEDAADTFIRLRDWFDDQPDGPPGLTFTIEAVDQPTPSLFSSTAIETGMADMRTGHSATKLPSGQVLVTGGFFYDGSKPIALNSAELFDPVNQTWAIVASMHVTRFEHRATPLADGRVLVTGGSGGGGNLASAEIYDPATNTWTVVNPMSTPRVQHTATLLPSGKVLAVGGGGSVAATSAELYDPAANTWTPAGLLATWRWKQTATALTDGTVLVVGGEDNGTNYLADAERYDPVSNTWSAAGTLSAPRQNHVATLLTDGTVLVSGGSSNSAGLGVVLAERYNPVSNGWATVAPMSEPRLLHTATLLDDGNVFVVGGDNGTDPTLDTTEIYDPLLNIWSPADAVANARSLHIATLLTGGSVLIAGGLDFSAGFPPDTLATSELFDPAAGLWSRTAPRLRLNYAPDESGSAQIVIRATDTAGAWIEDTFQSTVNPVNDRPTFDPGTAQAATDENPLTHGPALVQTVPGWATNLDKGAFNESTQTLIFSVTSDNTALFIAGGQPAINASGTLTYTPAPNAHGTALVTVTLRDDGGTEFGGTNTGPTEQLFITITKPMVRHNSAPTTNPLANGLDVTDPMLGPPDGFIVAGDALTVINFLNAFGPKQFAANDFGPPYYDVNADTFVAASDALDIINYVNAFGAGAAGEGEAALPPVAADAADAVFEELGSRLSVQIAGGTTDDAWSLLLADAVEQVLTKSRRR